MEVLGRIRLSWRAQSAGSHARSHRARVDPGWQKRPPTASPTPPRRARLAIRALTARFADDQTAHGWCVVRVVCSGLGVGVSWVSDCGSGVCWGAGWAL